MSSRLPVLEGDRGANGGRLFGPNAAGSKEDATVKAGVSLSAYIIRDARSNQVAVALGDERGVLDGFCDGFEVLAGHIEPSLIGYVYIISALLVGVKGKMHLFSLFFLSPYKGNLN